MLSIIKIYATHYFKQPVVASLVAEYKKHEQFAYPKVYKRQFRKKCLQIDLREGGSDLLGHDMLRFAYLYAKDYFHQHQF